jgi:hypothetical protein
LEQEEGNEPRRVAREEEDAWPRDRVGGDAADWEKKYEACEAREARGAREVRGAPRQEGNDHKEPVVQRLVLFERGKAMSGAPIIIGTNQLPKPPIGTGITMRKSINRP